LKYIELAGDLKFNKERGDTAVNKMVKSKYRKQNKNDKNNIQKNCLGVLANLTSNWQT